VDVYALLHGILIAKEANIKQLKVIEDSMVVIKLMLFIISPSDRNILVLIARVNKDISFFFDISLFHVITNLNMITDKWATKALELSLGVILKNGEFHNNYNR
jgi:hypothetical protein